MIRRSTRTSYFGLTIALLLAATANAQWTIEEVDNAGDVGAYSSVIFDQSDNPAIAYQDRANKNLKFASWTGATWDIVVVDGGGVTVGATSLAQAAQGKMGISYRSDFGLKLATRPTTSWSYETVVSGFFQGRESSLAYDAGGIPAISAFDMALIDLSYTRWNGTSWQSESIPTGVNAGRFTSLAIDGAGNPMISFFDYSDTGKLGFAAWSGSAWTVEIVDQSLDTGWHTCLALDPAGYPVISYHDRRERDLKLASWNGTSWDIETIDSVGETGIWTSLVFDPQGRPAIAYNDWTNHNAMFATKRGSNWIIEVAAESGDVGYYTSLALDSAGTPAIAYFDATRTSLAIARRDPVTLLLLRGTIATISGAWRAVALPLTDANDDPTAPFPVDATAFSVVDDIIPSNAELTLYRLTEAGTGDAGNRLRAVDNAGIVKLSF